MTRTRKKLSKAEAGRIGGRMTARRHGVEHYRAAGRKGFMATVARHWQGDAAGYVRWLHARGWLQELQRASRRAERRASRSRPSPASTTRRTRHDQPGETRAPQGGGAQSRRKPQGEGRRQPDAGRAVHRAAAARTDLVRRRRPSASSGSAAFWRRVQELRASHRPADWTAGQVVALDAALGAWEANAR